MPGSDDRTAVRSAHASMTVRARERLTEPKAPSRAELKHTTSQRPNAGTPRSRPTPSRCAGSASGVPGSGRPGPNAGERFSNTATS